MTEEQLKLFKEWTQVYEKVENYIKPYLWPKQRYKLMFFDVFTYWPIVDVFRKQRMNFLKLSYENYYFHYRSGYLLHAFDRGFLFARKEISYSKIYKVSRPIPGRRIAYAKRISDGPRGGKLTALGSLTHISTDIRVISNPKTRRMLQRVKDIARAKKWKYPHIYIVEKRFPIYPFNKIKAYAFKIVWPDNIYT